jgi:hypothetical protein
MSFPMKASRVREGANKKELCCRGGQSWNSDCEFCLSIGQNAQQRAS